MQIGIEMIIKNTWVCIALLSIGIAKAHAVVCTTTPRGTPPINLAVDISGAINDLNANRPGGIADIRFNRVDNIRAECPRDSWGNNTSLRDYKTDLAIVGQSGSYTFLKINEYLSGAMRIEDSFAGYFYPPQQNVQMGFHPAINIAQPFPVDDKTFLLRLRIEKPFIGSMPINTGIMFRVYVKTKRGEISNNVIYTISYTGNIIAPQTCIVGAGTELNINFGEIPAHAFAQVGAGEKPKNVNTMTRSINIQCSNIDDMAKLNIRVLSDKVSNDTLISTNRNIGFKISDMANNILIPNNTKSNVPFKLTNSGAQILLKFWPVNFTGQRPEPGPFRSTGFLRAEFD